VEITGCIFASAFTGTMQFFASNTTETPRSTRERSFTNDRSVLQQKMLCPAGKAAYLRAPEITKSSKSMIGESASTNATPGDQKG
jgi:hypothetical protein